MREIKFRAWDGLRMIHFKDFSIGLAKGKKVKPYVYFLSDTFEGQVKFGEHQIMQWTGLVNKNGVEIYEGDLVEFYHKGQNVVCEIVYQGSGFKLKWTDGYINTWELNPSKYKIVGNIYENQNN